MQYVRFYKNEPEQGVELTNSHSATQGLIYFELMTEISRDKGTTTIKYPLNKKEYEKYQKQVAIIDNVLIQHDLLGKTESKYHYANLLFLIIEFNRKYKNLLADKARDARLSNDIKFLKLVKGLTSSQKQKVQMSFLINNEVFTFEDQAILSEIVINKIQGVLMNNITQLYPELWELYLKRGGNPKAAMERAKAESALQNQAVADITKRIIKYLNVESNKLRDPKAKQDKITLTSKQGNFIYDLLVGLEIYEPRDKSKADTNGKEANYHGLRKLIDRY
jgi:hypothetical protein